MAKFTIWTSDKVASFSAVLISLGTLLVFVYQTALIRQDQHMAVYPYLNMTNQNTGSGQYKFVLKNEGIGPAIITSVKITSPDKKVYHDFIQYVDDVFGDDDSVNYFHSNLLEGVMIPEKETVYLIQTGDNKESTGRKLRNLLNADQLKFEIEYQSVYGDKWVLYSDNNIPQKK